MLNARIFLATEPSWPQRPEYSTGIGTEGDNVAKGLEDRERLVDFYVVALAVALDGCCEAAEAGTDHYDFDACLLG